MGKIKKLIKKADENFKDIRKLIFKPKLSPFSIYMEEVASLKETCNY